MYPDCANRTVQITGNCHISSANILTKKKKNKSSTNNGNLRLHKAPAFIAFDEPGIYAA